jgi:hypothetical protein
MKNIIDQEEKDKIDAKCKQYNITNYIINGDGSIDVDGDVELQYTNISRLPIKFNKVSGDFNCSGNQMTTLEGCPKEVGTVFTCSSNNRLKSLKGGPEKVGTIFMCSNNSLTSLEFSPSNIVEDFDCSYNYLSNLEGCPKVVSDSFYCSSNKLTSLAHGPVTIGGIFDCRYNLLATLEHCPIKMGNFDCTFNDLNTLYHFPNEVTSERISFFDIDYCNTKYDNKGLNDFRKVLFENFIGEDYDNDADDNDPYLSDEIRIVYKYMKYYDVWTPEFNIDGMNELIAEIKDGLK